MIADLRELIERQERLLDEGDLTGFVAADRAFHHTIVAAAGNAILTRISDSLRDRQRRMVAATVAPRPRAPPPLRGGAPRHPRRDRGRRRRRGGAPGGRAPRALTGPDRAGRRLELATHLAEKGGVYILDEPTTGLHLADVEHLLGLLDRLVNSGTSVIVIEHHQAVMAHADWIIDLGPGAGHDGGRVVFERAPADLVAARSTLTGEHLAAYISR